MIAVVPSQKITAETVCAGLREGLTVTALADRFGVSERTMRRRMAEIRKADPAAMPLARELGNNTRTTAPARNLSITPAVVLEQAPPERLIPPEFGDDVSDAEAGRRFLRWALQTPLGVDPAKIAAAKCLIDRAEPSRPAVELEDPASVLEQVIEATADVESEQAEPTVTH